MPTAPGEPLPTPSAQVLNAEQQSRTSSPRVATPRSVSLAPPPNPDIQGRPQLNAPAAERSGTQLDAVLARDRDILSQVPVLASLAVPTTINPALINPSPPTAPLAVDVEMVPQPHMGMPESESPLTTNPSPGNVGLRSSRVASPAGSHVEQQAPSSVARTNAAASDGNSSDEDEPMETGEDWAVGDTRKRREDEIELSGDERAAKRHAGDITSGDEDADGSSDDEAQPAPAPAAVNRQNAARSGRARAAGTSTAVAARRAGPRTRSRRSG
ncbi:unnamed protein product [Peniophora sp. CBMAI 1063]|nr:unnamed protein product [Peniophora sp. CBMAI 1063]